MYPQIHCSIKKKRRVYLFFFILCIILSLGIAGPLITAFSYTDDLGKIGVIVDEIVGILDQPELNRPYKSTSVPKDNSHQEQWCSYRKRKG